MLVLQNLLKRHPRCYCVDQSVFVSFFWGTNLLKHRAIFGERLHMEAERSPHIIVRKLLTVSYLRVIIIMLFFPLPAVMVARCPNNGLRFVLNDCHLWYFCQCYNLVIIFNVATEITARDIYCDWQFRLNEHT